MVKMRKRVKELVKIRKTAVEEGGSSFNDTPSLIEELKSLRRA